MAVHSPAAPPRPTATKPRSKAAEPRPRLFDVEEYHRDEISPLAFPELGLRVDQILG